MRKTILINKKIGETPLEALERTRRRLHISKEVPMAYAGRLDPMVSGKLLLLVGDECKRQEWYHGLDKEYVVEVLLGIASDTGDVLGIISEGIPVTPEIKEIRKILTSFVGPYNAPYPMYSSKTVDGKPLFQWALEEKKVEAPLQHGTIHSIAYKGMRSITTKSLLQYVEKKIGTLAPVTEESKALGRDFRKEEALASWRTLSNARFPVITIRVRTSSGVYMRTLAGDIAEKLGAKGLALSITRTRICIRNESF